MNSSMLFRGKEKEKGNTSMFQFGPIMIWPEVLCFISSFIFIFVALTSLIFDQPWKWAKGAKHILLFGFSVMFTFWTWSRLFNYHECCLLHSSLHRGIIKYISADHILHLKFLTLCVSFMFPLLSYYQNILPYNTISIYFLKKTLLQCTSWKGKWNFWNCNSKFDKWDLPVVWITKLNVQINLYNQLFN